MRAESAGAVDIDWFDRPALAHVIDASDKGSGVSNRCADADLAGFASYTERADIDVVAAGGEVKACTWAQSNIG